MSAAFREAGSSDSDGPPDTRTHIAKKTRITQACDFCKRRKVKCDGITSERPKCSSCTSSGRECSFTTMQKKRGPAKRQRAGSDNEDDHVLAPHLASTSKSGSIIVPADAAHYSRSPEAQDPKANPDIQSLSEWLERVKIDPLQWRQSINDTGISKLVKSAIAVRRESFKPPSQTKRPEFWSPYPWELDELKLYATQTLEQPYIFPDPDLFPLLVDYYFTESNLYLPVLHRPTFDKSVAAGLHLRDPGFGGVVLLVCAVGARYTDDPRVFLPGERTQSAGWGWYNQCQIARRSILAPPHLYDIQQYCLATNFLAGSSAPHITWTLIGAGLRMALDVSAHRGKLYKGVGQRRILEEQWKRAFWVLIHMDRSAAMELGKTLSILDEDIDCTLPVECDDEYWEGPDPDQYFKQPPGKPSTVAYFNCALELKKIQCFALRTLLSYTRVKKLEWEMQMVRELDAALQEWFKRMPAHLRWDPFQPDSLFLRQAAVLNSMYHYTRIMIHRPFISAARRSTPLAPVSLAASLDSAKHIASMTGSMLERANMPIKFQWLSTFSAACVLVVGRWSASAGVASPTADELADARTCMRLLQACESRWQVAGRYRDILAQLIEGTTGNAMHADIGTGTSVPPSFPTEPASVSDPGPSTMFIPPPGLPSGMPAIYSSSEDYLAGPSSSTDLSPERSLYEQMLDSLFGQQELPGLAAPQDQGGEYGMFQHPTASQTSYDWAMSHLGGPVPQTGADLLLAAGWADAPPGSEGADHAEEQPPATLPYGWNTRYPPSS